MKNLLSLIVVLMSLCKSEAGISTVKSAAPKLREFLLDNKVMLFVKENCQFCSKVREILDRHKVQSYQIVDVDKYKHGRSLFK